jgi:iron complex outermembrane receptor protein
MTHSFRLVRATGAAVVAGVLVTAGAASAQNLNELKHMTLEQLAALEVVSVSKRAEPFGQAPAAIQVITQEDIRRSGATTIPEALRLADNLIVAQKNSHDWAITARGFNTDLANKLLVMIDGRTVYTPLFSGVFWDRQDYLLEDIDRIEVVGGPGGTLWGANAVNGVINIITRQASASQGLYAYGEAGSQVNGDGGVRYGGALGTRGFYRVYGQYGDHDQERLASGGDAHDAWRRTQTGFRVDASSPASRHTLTIQGDGYYGREQIATGRVADVSGGNLLGRWTYKWSEARDFSIQTYYDRTHLGDPIPALTIGPLTVAAAGTLEDDLDTFDVDSQYRFSVTSRHRLTSGFGYRFTHDVVENAPGLGFDPPRLDRQLFSAFAQDEISLTSRVAVTVGTKVEHNDYTGVEWEPSARVQWLVTPKHTVWGAVSRAVRAPARVDRDERLSTPGLAPLVQNLLIGGANFQSETVLAYEAGARVQLGRSVSASVSTFYNRYDDLRSTSLSAPDPVLHLPFPLFFENNLEGHTYGATLSADYQLVDWWRVHGGYAFLGEDLHVRPGTFDFNNALNETADPENRFNLRSSLTIARFEVDAQLRWVDDFVFNNSGVANTVASYAELGGRVAWLPTPKLELSVSAQNLLHDQHLEYVISSPNPREEIARTVMAKAAVRW